MRKFILLIIGIVGIAFSLNVAYADDCTSTLYDPVFTCKAKSINGYCTLEAKLTRSSSPSFNLYESEYCDITKDVDDEIYAVLADQFKIEDPKIDKDAIKSILTDKPLGMYERVKTAYQRERIIFQSKQSLKRQFQSSEMWYNASLDDSPFDLVVDLNLIEIVLFGSRAEWSDNVWNWPKSEDATSAEEPGMAPGQTPGGAKTPNADTGTVEPNAPGENPPEQYECVPDDTLGGLLGGDDGTGGGKPTPQPGEIPANCGNGKLETGEACDDGNNLSGDGCSESCQKEAGADLSCKDNEAVTFKQLGKSQPPKPADTTKQPGGTTNPTANPDTPPLDCPPGSTATEKPTTQAGKEAKVVQDPNYPGPFVGGVLKNYPPSEKPDCPPGESFTEISAVGFSAKSICFPTKFCADFDSAREMLFGSDFKTNPAKKDAAASLEVSVCVDIKKVKRPESPYPLNEGCIDCNILAMNDIMSKMLDKNVNPLQNSMQSWGSSNRWGPTVSFNLNVLTKPFLRSLFSKDYAQKLTDKEKSDLAFQIVRQDAAKSKDSNSPAVVPGPSQNQDLLKTGEDYNNQQAKKKEDEAEAVRYAQTVSNASAEQLAYGGITAKLRELKKAFEDIQAKYVQLAVATKFQEKEKCSF